MAKTVKFARETPQIKRIVNRWFAHLKAMEIKPDYDKLDVTMDLCAVLAQGQVKLDLTKLERFDDFEFVHDMAGIINCMDRTTGLLRNCFLPRAAR